MKSKQKEKNQLAILVQQMAMMAQTLHDLGYQLIPLDRLDSEDVMLMLNICPSTLQKYTKKGLFAYSYMSGKPIYYEYLDVLNFAIEKYSNHINIEANENGKNSKQRKNRGMSRIYCTSPSFS
jgi:hypothetical protein